MSAIHHPRRPPAGAARTGVFARGCCEGTPAQSGLPQEKQNLASASLTAAQNGHTGRVGLARPHQRHTTSLRWFSR